MAQSRNNLNELIRIRISTSDKVKYTKESEKRGLSLSAYIRSIVNQHIDAQQNKMENIV